ncbi:MAG TPA: hypothetical protein VFA46_13565 [Actinomycetes bacterium]|jgi:hypothetical protein|nr:hypothetical protein [Actinomycetes bacterium]
MPSDAHADRLTVPLRCDFCGREVPGPIRLLFTWTAIQYRWCERCQLPTGSPVELLLDPPISPN